jgi:serine protease Do
MEYYEPNETRRPTGRKGVGASLLIVCTAVAVVIGLVAGILLTVGSNKAQETKKDAGLPILSAVLGEEAASPAKPAEAADAPSVSIAETAQVGTGFAYDGPYTRAQVVELCAPSVVGIDATFDVTVSYWGAPQTVEQSGSGSGVILTADGYIATCAHVVEGAKSITVTLNDDVSYPAEIVGTDARNDLAIIRIDATGLVPATLGDSDMLTVGEDVIAIGNPLGELRGTATSGIVSAVRRSVVVEGSTMELVQTDAAISPGNSGGGLFNSSGRLIGIVNAKVSSNSAEGLGFAIPVNSVVNEINDLLHYGYVTGRAYLGVYTQNVTLSNGYGYYAYGGMRCVEITDVVPDSAADEAGLRAGDLILAVDGRTISTNDDLSDAIASYNAGEEAVLTVRRDGRRIECTVVFGEYVP